MKIGLIAFNNIKYCPYINCYTTILNEQNIDYSIIYFDRDGENCENEKIIPIYWNKKKSKLFNFVCFKKKVIKILNKKSFDYLIVLTTLPGILLQNYLKRKYKYKYIIDIRDYTYEKYFIFYYVEKKMIKYSTMSVISSLGFINFLPKYEYTLCHNTTYTLPNNHYPSINKKESIIIGYVGTISYKKYCKKLIDLVLNDDRFCFYFYGNESNGDEIQNCIATLNNNRIKYFGKYSPSEKGKIIEKIDILFNVYGNESPLVKYALSNKLYDAFFYRKPLLTSKDTFMSTYASIYSFDLDINIENLNALYDWYVNIDVQKMNNFMNNKENQFFYENENFKLNIINKICKGGKNE